METTSLCVAIVGIAVIFSMVAPIVILSNKDDLNSTDACCWKVVSLFSGINCASSIITENTYMFLVTLVILIITWVRVLWK